MNEEELEALGGLHDGGLNDSITVEEAEIYQQLAAKLQENGKLDNENEYLELNDLQTRFIAGIRQLRQEDKKKMHREHEKKMQDTMKSNIQALEDLDYFKERAQGWEKLYNQQETALKQLQEQMEGGEPRPLPVLPAAAAKPHTNPYAYRLIPMDTPAVENQFGDKCVNTLHRLQILTDPTRAQEFKDEAEATLKSLDKDVLYDDYKREVERPISNIPTQIKDLAAGILKNQLTGQDKKMFGVTVPSLGKNEALTAYGLKTNAEIIRGIYIEDGKEHAKYDIRSILKKHASLVALFDANLDLAYELMLNMMRGNARKYVLSCQKQKFPLKDLYFGLIMRLEVKPNEAEVTHKLKKLSETVPRRNPFAVMREIVATTNELFAEQTGPFADARAGAMTHQHLWTFLYKCYPRYLVRKLAHEMDTVCENSNKLPTSIAGCELLILAAEKTFQDHLPAAQPELPDWYLERESPEEKAKKKKEYGARHKEYDRDYAMPVQALKYEASEAETYSATTDETDSERRSRSMSSDSHAPAQRTDWSKPMFGPDSGPGEPKLSMAEFFEIAQLAQQLRYPNAPNGPRREFADKQILPRPRQDDGKEDRCWLCNSGAQVHDPPYYRQCPIFPGQTPGQAVCQTCYGKHALMPECPVPVYRLKRLQAKERPNPRN